MKSSSEILITDRIRLLLKDVSHYVRYVELQKVLIKDIHKSKATASFLEIRDLLGKLDAGKRKIKIKDKSNGSKRKGKRKEKEKA